MKDVKHGPLSSDRMPHPFSSCAHLAEWKLTTMPRNMPTDSTLTHTARNVVSGSPRRLRGVDVQLGSAPIVVKLQAWQCTSYTGVATNASLFRYGVPGIMSNAAKSDYSPRDGVLRTCAGCSITGVTNICGAGTCTSGPVGYTCGERTRIVQDRRSASFAVQSLPLCTEILRAGSTSDPPVTFLTHSIFLCNYFADHLR